MSRQARFRRTGSRTQGTPHTRRAHPPCTGPRAHGRARPAAHRARRGGIGRHLATTVIHRVFGAALILQSAASLAGGQASSRLQQAVAELDALIRDVRMAVIEPLTSAEPDQPERPSPAKDDL